MLTLTIEPTGEATTGTCDCCGKQSRRVWGLVYADNSAHAMYFIQWTDGHVAEFGVLWDIVVGAWGEGTGANDRYAVRLRYRAAKPAGFMVIDADPGVTSEIASNALRREDVVGGPLAKQIFDICDAVYLQDPRLKEVLADDR